MNTREVSSLPLSQSLLDSLRENGFDFVHSLVGVRPIDLSKELRVSLDEAISILRLVEQSTELPAAQSAKDLITKKSVGRPIITFCRELDNAIGGGVPLGQITEFCGVPGIGKTQIAMQLAVDVQIPEVLGGNGGEAIYIDTEGSFMVQRVAQISDAVSLHLSRIAKGKKLETKSKELGVDLSSLASAMTRNRLLEGINVFRVHDQLELLALVAQLPGLLRLNSKIKLVIFDSIAFHFRQSINEPAVRNRLLSTLSQQLNHLAFEFNCAVVVTNHMTTKVESSGHTVVPALGELWSHCITNRIALGWSGAERTATVAKSPAWPAVQVVFSVIEAGVRDLLVAKKMEVEEGRKRKATDMA